MKNNGIDLTKLKEKIADSKSQNLVSNVNSKDKFLRGIVTAVQSSRPNDVTEHIVNVNKKTQEKHGVALNEKPITKNVTQQRKPEPFINRGGVPNPNRVQQLNEYEEPDDRYDGKFDNNINELINAWGGKKTPQNYNMPSYPQNMGDNERNRLEMERILKNNPALSQYFTPPVNTNSVVESTYGRHNQAPLMNEQYGVTKNMLLEALKDTLLEMNTIDRIKRVLYEEIDINDVIEKKVIEVIKKLQEKSKNKN